MKIDKSWYQKPKDKNFPRKVMAGGVVVRRDGGKLLLAFVGDRKFTNYVLPKGKVEKGESELRAATREVEEELGLSKLKLINKLGEKQRLTFDKDSWNTYHYFLFTTDQKSGTQKLQEGKQDFFLAWFDIDNLPEFFWPEQRELVEENLEIIKKLLS